MKPQKLIHVGVIIYTIINFIQAVFQPLLLDEAYYYYYSQHLNWGYFDHPPLVALIAKAGSFLGRTEIGVRLGSVILSGLTFYFLLRMIKRSIEEIDVNTILLLFGFPFVGTLFLSIPDSGLLFFSVLFYFVFERYLKEDSYLNALYLGLISAGLIYSKYHGTLTILFVVIANVQLLKRRTLWFAFGIFILALIPHLFWLFEHDWITVKFQLFGRGSGGFSVRNIIEYIALFGFVIAGLFIIPMLQLRSLKNTIIASLKEKNTIGHTLMISVIGFLVFFLIFSTRGPIEMNWLFSASIPLLILFGRSNILETKLSSYTIYLSVIIVFLFRIMLVTSCIPKIGYLHVFTGYKKWANDIENKANGKTVFFENSYQMASMYSFQTGKKSYSLNTLGNRSNQYDFECLEPISKNTEVFIVSEWMKWENPLDTMNHEKGIYKYNTCSGLTFLNGTKLELEKIEHINNVYNIDLTIEQNCNVSIVELDKNERIKIVLELNRPAINPDFIELVSAEYQLSEKRLSLKVLLNEDVEFIRVGLKVDNGPISNNSDKIRLP